MRTHTLIVSLCLSLFSTTLSAAEPAATATSDTPAKTPALPRMDWRAELKAQLDAKEVVELPLAGGAPLLALYRPQTKGRAEGGVILLHDKGAHPDWPGVIHPLRHALPEHGWSTLAIETPELPTDTEQLAFDQLSTSLMQRIDAAMVFLNQQNIYNTALIGHGQGALLAAAYLAQRPQNTLSGLVMIGMDTPTDIDERFAPLSLLEQIQKPMLDIYGAQDTESAVAMASRRASAARKSAQQAMPQAFAQAGHARSYGRQQPGLIAYRQFEVAGANHNFDGLAEPLSKRIRGWLQRHAAGREIAIGKP